MLNYLALLKVDRPRLWSQWHSGSTASYFKSPISSNKEDVEDWIKNELKKYPDASINEFIDEKEYLIYHTIIAFDVEQSSNVDTFLEHFY